MTRLAGWTGSVVLLALLAAAPLQAAAPIPPPKTPLGIVPDKAPLVLYLHGVERTRDRFLTTFKASLPELAPNVETQLNDWLKNGVAGKFKLDGLDKDGPVFLALLEMPRNLDKPPKAAVIVAVKDYAKFRDGILFTDENKKNLKKNDNGVEEAQDGGETLYFLDRNGWAIVALDKEAIESFTKEFKGLDTKMSKEQAAKLLDGDAGLYVAMDAVNKEYGEQIKDAKKEFSEAFFQQLEQAGTLDKATIKVYKTMIEGVFQAVEDSHGVLATVEFRPSGVALHMETELRPGTASSKTLQEFQTSPFADLSRLPSGQMYYSGAKPTGPLVDALGPLMYGIQGDPKADEDKAIKAALDKIIKAGLTETVSSMSLPWSGVAAQKFKDGAAAIDGHRDLIRALKADGAYGGLTLKDKPALKLKAQKHQNIEFDEISLAFDMEKFFERATQGQPLPEEVKAPMIATYKKLYGEKLTWWLGTDGKTVLQVIAPDWKSAQKMLDGYFSGKGTLGEEAAYKELRKELPAEVSMIWATDPALFGAVMVDSFRIGFDAAAMGAIKWPANYPAKPAKHLTTYFGLAVSLKRERGCFDVFLSANGVQECYKAFAKPFLD